MKSAKRITALLMAVVLCLCAFSGCNREEEQAAEQRVLSVGYEAFNGAFSPFYAELPADRDVVAMTQLPLLSTDRAGEVILNGIHGQTTVYNGTEYTYTGLTDAMIINNEDGTVDYAFTLREDISFSDGTPLTADDVIFTMYVLCDPMYDGPNDFASLPIKGLSEYRTGMTAKWKLILQDTPTNTTNGSAAGYYTAEEALTFWATFNRVGVMFAETIVGRYIANGIGEDVRTVAEAIGYPGLPEGAEAVDLFNAIVDRRGYDVQAIDKEQVAQSFEELLLTYLEDELRVGVVTDESATEIEGIRKTGAHSLRVTLTQADVTALSLFCIDIAPMHYYGDTSLYSDQDKTYGFLKGDLTKVRQQGATPMGAGPYKFLWYKDGIVSFKANETYYRGEPKVAEIQFKRVVEARKIDRLQSGVFDLTIADLSNEAVSAVEKANGGVLNGDTLAVKTVYDAAYGYLGISADGVKVGDDPASLESQYLRRALATVFAYYRQASLENYYGKGTESTGYPFGLDDTAFSKDISGETIWLDPDVSAEERQNEMLRVALEYLAAAGYTVEDGRVTEVPEGAALIYDLWFVGNAAGSSQAYLMLEYARNAFATIGITLVLQDRTSESDLQNAIRSERAKIWYTSRETMTQADMYSVYSSYGGTAYALEMNDSTLNKLLWQARGEEDEAKRRALYADCLDIVEAWGTEVPICQEKRALIFSVSAVDGSTIAQDVTGHYGWIREIEKLAMTG